MSETIWIKHPETGAVVEVPASALPMYRQSNWEPLSDREVAARAQAAADEVAEAERAMQDKAAIALGEAEPTPTETSAEPNDPDANISRQSEENV